MGLMLGPANTDAVNRASRLSYGEATGITQTVRNYSASLGLAILGTILVSQMRSRITASLIAQGLSTAHAHVEASSLSQSQSGSGSIASIPHFVRLDFAYATRSVLYVMAAIMAAAAVVALLGLERGRPAGGGGRGRRRRGPRPRAARARLTAGRIDARVGRSGVTLSAAKSGQIPALSRNGNAPLGG